MNLIVTIAIDDVHPQKGWRILGDKTEMWLRELHEQFGARFTLFIPSNYHGQYPLSEHKEWVKELASIEWLELAAHGHLHMTSDPKRFGECEMLELNTSEDCSNRYADMMQEWMECGVSVSGWRNPGWLCSPMWNDYIRYIKEMYNNTFEYVAVHYEHNKGMTWPCKTFFGHDGIQQEKISVHNGDMIMFQSHIAGNHNHNVWNSDNFEQLKLSLDYLTKNHSCEFKTLKEC
jgi:hypothetical protein